MRELKLFEQIEDYLLNRLSPEARQAFEAAMAADPGLKGQVALHRDMMQAIEEQEDVDMEKPPSKDILDLRVLMENAYQEFQAEKVEENNSDLPKTPSGKSWIRYVVIAAVLLLVALGVWWTQRQATEEIGKKLPESADTLQTPPPIQNQEPIAETPLPTAQTPSDTLPPPGQDYAAVAKKAYADSPYDAGVLMGDEEPDEPGESLLQKASEAFAQKQYYKTVVLLQKLPEEGRTEALKLRAHAYFQLGRYDRATNDFKELTTSISYQHDAEWYLLLCYAARLPKTRAAYNALLSKVSAVGHPFEQKAKRLKASMD